MSIKAEFQSIVPNEGSILAALGKSLVGVHESDIHVSVASFTSRRAVRHFCRPFEAANKQATLEDIPLVSDRGRGDATLLHRRGFPQEFE